MDFGMVGLVILVTIVIYIIDQGDKNRKEMEDRLAERELHQERIEKRREEDRKQRAL